jgi:hypothetical protein
MGSLEIFPQLAWNFSLSEFSLSSSLDYRSEPLVPSSSNYIFNKVKKQPKNPNR